VFSEDVGSENFSVELGLCLFRVNDLSSLTLDLLNASFLITWESLGAVGHVDATVAGTLEHTEHSGTGGGWGKTDIKEGLEWSSVILDVLVNVEVFTINGFIGLVHVGETNLLKQSSGEEETSAVGSSVVGESGGDTEVLQFRGLSSAEDLITLHGREDDLSNEFSVSSSDNESIFLGVIFVLILSDKSLSSI